jgi:hypothetical protein
MTPFNEILTAGFDTYEEWPAEVTSKLPTEYLANNSTYYVLNYNTPELARSAFTAWAAGSRLPEPPAAEGTSEGAGDEAGAGEGAVEGVHEDTAANEGQTEGTNGRYRPAGFRLKITPVIDLAMIMNELQGDAPTNVSGWYGPGATTFHTGVGFEAMAGYGWPGGFNINGGLSLLADVSKRTTDPMGNPIEDGDVYTIDGMVTAGYTIAAHPMVGVNLWAGLKLGYQWSDGDLFMPIIGPFGMAHFDCQIGAGADIMVPISNKIAFTGGLSVWGVPTYGEVEGERPGTTYRAYVENSHVRALFNLGLLFDF